MNRDGFSRCQKTWISTRKEKLYNQLWKWQTVTSAWLGDTRAQILLDLVLDTSISNVKVFISAKLNMEKENNQFLKISHLFGGLVDAIKPRLSWKLYWLSGLHLGYIHMEWHEWTLRLQWPRNHDAQRQFTSWHWGRTQRSSQCIWNAVCKYKLVCSNLAYVIRVWKILWLLC